MTPNPQGIVTGDDAGETAPRPKFSRRPASFSRAPSGSAPVVMADEPLLTPPVTHYVPNPRHVAPTHTAWQEDARFGVVMIVLVLLVNLALVYGLPLLPDSTSSNGPTQVTAKAPTMPNAVGRRANNVTLYSQPEEERRTIYQLDLRNAGSEQNTLSVSPSDIPAPTARALDAPIEE